MLTVRWKETSSHSDFVKQMIAVAKKGEMFTLFPRPHIVDPPNTIHVFGSCVACGESLESAFFVGTFMLACRHQYHPLCFSFTLQSRGVCAKPGCETVIPQAAKSWMSRHLAKKCMYLQSFLFMSTNDNFVVMNLCFICSKFFALIGKFFFCFAEFYS